MITRREAIKTTALLTATAAVMPGALAQSNATAQTPAAPFTLPPLPYAFDALEPHIDARTMEIHHDKHHAGYVANLNKAVATLDWSGPMTLGNLLASVPTLPAAQASAIRNNGGGHYNHSLFWQMMSKTGGGEPKAELASAIEAAFGSFTGFKDAFAKAAITQFGSGWAWLAIRNKDKRLIITSTPNQDVPLTLYDDASGPAPETVKHTPLLALDVWEHAYYLKYQNKRADYINAWWNVVNWDFVTERYLKAKS